MKPPPARTMLLALAVCGAAGASHAAPPTAAVRIGPQSMTMTLPPGSTAERHAPGVDAVTFSTPVSAGQPAGFVRLEAWPLRAGESSTTFTKQYWGWLLARCEGGNVSVGVMDTLDAPQDTPEITYVRFSCSSDGAGHGTVGVAKLTSTASGMFIATRAFETPAKPHPAFHRPLRWAAVLSVGTARLIPQPASPNDAASYGAASMLTLGGQTLVMTLPPGYAEDARIPGSTNVTFLPGLGGSEPAGGVLWLDAMRSDPFTAKIKWDSTDMFFARCGGGGSADNSSLPWLPPRTDSERIINVSCATRVEGQDRRLVGLLKFIRGRTGVFTAARLWAYPVDAPEYLPEPLRMQALAELAAAHACDLGTAGCNPIALTATPRTSPAMNAVRFGDERLTIALPPDYVSMKPPTDDQNGASLGPRTMTDPGYFGPLVELVASASANDTLEARLAAVSGQMGRDCHPAPPSPADDGLAHARDGNRAGSASFSVCGPSIVGGVRVIQGKTAIFAATVAWVAQDRPVELSDAMREQARRLLATAHVCTIGTDCP